MLTRTYRDEQRGGDVERRQIVPHEHRQWPDWLVATESKVLASRIAACEVRNLRVAEVTKRRDVVGLAGLQTRRLGEQNAIVELQPLGTKSSVVDGAFVWFKPPPTFVHSMTGHDELHWLKPHFRNMQELLFPMKLSFSK